MPQNDLELADFFQTADVEQAETKPEEPSAPAKTPRRRLTNAAKAIIAKRRESNPAFERHSRKCEICNHPDIEEIEDEFVNWASAHWLEEAFGVGEYTIYRHARAAGLDVLRRENLGVVVEKVLQEVDHVDAPNVAEVLRAVRILSRLNRQGQWVGPLTSTDSPRRAEASAEAANRKSYELLEVGVTHTKEGIGADSNRQKT